jgi:hypothetical protein
VKQRNSMNKSFTRPGHRTGHPSEILASNCILDSPLSLHCSQSSVIHCWDQPQKAVNRGFIWNLGNKKPQTAVSSQLQHTTHRAPPIMCRNMMPRAEAPLHQKVARSRHQSIHVALSSEGTESTDLPQHAWACTVLGVTSKTKSYCIILFGTFLIPWWEVEPECIVSRCPGGNIMLYVLGVHEHA